MAILGQPLGGRCNAMLISSRDLLKWFQQGVSDSTRDSKELMQEIGKKYSVTRKPSVVDFLSWVTSADPEIQKRNKNTRNSNYYILMRQQAKTFGRGRVWSYHGTSCYESVNVLKILKHFSVKSVCLFAEQQNLKELSFQNRLMQFSLALREGLSASPLVVMCALSAKWWGKTQDLMDITVSQKEIQILFPT